MQHLIELAEARGCEWNRSLPQNRRRVIQEDFVDHSRTERGRIYPRSAFDHHTCNFKFAQAAQHRFHVRPSISGGLDALNMNATRFPFALLFFFRSSVRE